MLRLALPLAFVALATASGINVGTKEGESNVVSQGVVLPAWMLSTHTNTDPCKSYWRSFFVTTSGGGAFPLRKNTSHVEVRDSSIGSAQLFKVQDHLAVHFICTASGTLVANLTLTDPYAPGSSVSVFWSKECVSYEPWRFLVDPGNLGMITIAVILVAWGAIRSDVPPAAIRRLQEETGGSQEINWQGAISFVVGASCALLLIFYFLKQMQILLTITMSFASVTAVTVLIMSLMERYENHPSLATTVDIPQCGPVSYLELGAVSVSLIVVICWFFTRHWFWNNIIGASLCLYMMSMLQLNSIKIAALLLTMLFFYDIFWVFFSSHFFGDGKQSVMVVAATGLDLPIKLVLPRVLTPCLESSMTMLGLGDIALPGLLIAFTRRFDTYIHRKSRCPGTGRHPSDGLRWLSRPHEWLLLAGYFHVCLCGYLVGMMTCFVVLFVFKAAQPALLYLVPCTLGPVTLLGYQHGEVGDLWHGIVHAGGGSEDARDNQELDPETGLAVERDELLTSDAQIAEMVADIEHNQLQAEQEPPRSTAAVAPGEEDDESPRAPLNPDGAGGAL